jgi:hypothetical protein
VVRRPVEEDREAFGEGHRPGTWFAGSTASGATSPEYLFVSNSTPGIRANAFCTISYWASTTDYRP